MLPQPASTLQPSATYANVLQQDKCPTKEQAVVLDAIDGLTIENYCAALAKIVDPVNVRYISRISQRRICVYLSSVELAEKLVYEIKQLEIKEHLLEIRPLYTKTKRILISNVQPHIPSSEIEKELLKNGVTPMSKITQIKATSVTTPGFSHLMSFRRQMYIQPEDISKLPETLKITYDDMACWIYFSTDKLICFICKQEGHTQKYCQNISMENPLSHQTNQTVEESVSPNTTKPPDRSEDKKSSAKETNSSLDNISMPPPPIKRTRSSTASTTSDTGVVPKLRNTSTSKHANKKHKPTTTSPSMEEIILKLDLAKEYIDSKDNNLQMNLQSTANFIAETYGRRDIKDIAYNFTKDLIGLHEHLSSIYSYIKDRHMKSRITKIKKHLMTPVNMTTTSDSESESISEQEEFLELKKSPYEFDKAKH